MKTLLLAALSLCFASNLPAAEPAPRLIRSAAWLENGCENVALAKTKRATQTQQLDAIEVLAWLDGIVSGLNVAATFTESLSSISEPPEEWLHPPNMAPSILKFIQEHRGEIRPEMRAWDVICAWYVTTHPRASDLQKRRARATLSETFKASKEQGTAEKPVSAK